MTHVTRSRRMILLTGASLLFLSMSARVQSAPHPIAEYHIPAQDLGTALRTVGRIAGYEVMFPTDVVAGKHAPRLDGRYTAEQAIGVLLNGSSLSADFQGDTILIRGRETPEA